MRNVVLFVDRRWPTGPPAPSHKLWLTAWLGCVQTLSCRRELNSSRDHTGEYRSAHMAVVFESCRGLRCRSFCHLACAPCCNAACPADMPMCGSARSLITC